MGLNFLGLGFSFGAQDKGLGKMIKSTAAGIAGIGTSIAGVGLKSAKMGLGAAFEGLAGAGSTMMDLAQDTKVTTTFLEAFGVQANKVTSATLAGLNMNDKEFRKAKGEMANIAFSMNEDVGTITKGFVALKQAGIDVTEVGFKDQKEFAKFISVTGSSSEAMAASFGVMKNRLKLSSDEMKETFTSTMAAGKAMDMGREAADNFANTMLLIDKNLDKMPAKWQTNKKAQMAFAKGTTIVAGGLIKLGTPTEAAMQAAQGLGAEMLKGQAHFQDMFSGIENKMGASGEVLTEHFGSAEDAFQMLSDSPEKFIGQMGKVYEQIKKTSGVDKANEMMARFSSQMGDAFNPETIKLVKGYGQVGPLMEKAAGPLKDHAKILGNIAGKHSDGRSEAEKFAITQDRLLTKMKSIDGVMSDTEFNRNYAKGTEIAIKATRDFAGKGGILGKAATTLVNFRVHGIGGTIGAMGPMGAAFSSLATTMAPVMSSLPAITKGMKLLMNPFLLVTAAIAGLYFVMQDLQKGADSVVRPFIEKLKKSLPGLLAKAGEFISSAFDKISAGLVWIFNNIPWDAVGNVLHKAFTGLINIIVNVFRIIPWGKIGTLLAKGFSVLVAGIVHIFEIIPWAKVGQTIVKGFEWVFNKIPWAKIGQILG